MKLFKIFVMSVCVLALASCSDELPDTVQPTPGEAVIFTAKLSESKRGSRTIYADEATTDGNGNVASWRINWLNEDQINVYSPQCMSGYNKAAYTVCNTKEVDGTTVSDNSLNYAITLAPSAKGIQWGTEQKNDFYAVYPYVEGTENFSTGTNGKMQITAKVSDSQTNSIPLYNYTKTIDGTNTEYVFMKGDMPNNVMYAHTADVDNGIEQVDLSFIPVSTVLQFDISSLRENKDGETTYEAMTVQSILLESPTNMPIAGNMVIEPGTSASDELKITLPENSGSNIIELTTTYDVVDNDGTTQKRFVTIPAGGRLQCNFFITVPTDKDYNMRQASDAEGGTWKITVNAIQGKYSYVLSSDADEQGININPGQIHQLKLPEIQIDGDWSLNLDKWISLIPDEVYLTELSFPGAWYALQSEYQGTHNTVDQLFAAGVRCFNSENKSATSGVGDFTPSSVIVSGTGNNGVATDEESRFAYYYVTDQSKYIGTDLMKPIITELKEHPQEFFILCCSYADGGDTGRRPRDFAYWLQGLYAEYNKLSDEEKAYIYQNEIGPNTTVGQVRGKLILKINADSRIPSEASSSSIIVDGRWSFKYEQNLPAIFSNVEVEWITGDVGGVEQGDYPLIAQCHWMNWYNTGADNSPYYAVNVPDFNWSSAAPLDANYLYCAYTNGNRTYHTNPGEPNPSNTDGLPTSNDRKNAISNLVQYSSKVHDAKKHNVLFYIGAGGNRATTRDGSTVTGGPEHFAAQFNSYLNNEIVNKINNNDASPMGMVVCNFIAETVTDPLAKSDGVTPITFDGNDLIKNILNLNNLFYLNRAESPSGSKSVKSVSPNHSSGFKSGASASSGSWSAI